MYRKSALAFAFSVLTLTSTAWAGDIMVTDSYARSASASARTGAAFVVITNHGTEDDRLIGVASPVAQRVQLHTHEEDTNGVVKMLHIKQGLNLPSGGKIAMQRGGDHIMFMGLTDAFEQGAMIPLTLEFEKAGMVEIEVPVDFDRKPGHAQGHSHGTSE